MARDDTRPIVIKRIKKHAAGHHGGAWKIAYADFVTAMMAFFLLMWLLGSTAKGDLNGIAEYFSTPLAVAMRGGSGAGDASSVIQGGGQDLTRTAGQVKRGETDAEKRTYHLAAMKAELARQERLKLEDIKSKVEAAIAANPGIAQFRSQILLDITREGLRIQIVDDQNRPMFDTGRAVLKPYAAEILREIGAVLNGVDHKISLAGHTDSSPYAGGEKGYSNWELSTARANASRRELLGAGLDEGKVIRVVGLAASVPFDVADPKAPANRRISIVVLNKQAEETLKSGAVTVEAADAADAQKALEATAAAAAAAPEAPAAPAPAPAPAPEAPATRPQR